MSAESAPKNSRLRLVGKEPRENVSPAAMMAALGDESRRAVLLAKVCFLARARYGILPQDAEDIFHEAVATYLAIRDRYRSEDDNHFGLLVGIFHKKALEFLDVRDRQGRVAKRFLNRMQADRPDVARGEDPSGSAVERVLRAEDAELIRAVIAALSTEVRDLLLTLAEGRMTRMEMIEVLGVNPNTFDTRLRGARRRLRKSLAACGVL